MSPRKPGASPEEIAAMLRTGSTYREIKQRLHVSHDSIAAARKAHGIPLSQRPALANLSPEEQRATVEARYPRIAAMLRAGKTHQQIRDELGGSSATISLVRAILDIPSPRNGRAPATLTEAFDRYLQPYGNGHARWTGPTSEADGRGVPQLFASGRRYNPRREIFRTHHGRDPEGQLSITCTQARCVAGAHLADALIRETTQQAQQAERRLTATYTAIFGPDAP